VAVVSWIPAFAGMTGMKLIHHLHSDSWRTSTPLLPYF